MFMTQLRSDSLEGLAKCYYLTRHFVQIEKFSVLELERFHGLILATKLLSGHSITVAQK